MCTIGRKVVFSLTPWSGQIPMGFPVSHSTRVFDKLNKLDFTYRVITFFDSPFQTIQLSGVLSRSRQRRDHAKSHDPLHQKMQGLGSSLFARRYWGNLIRFLFLRILRCFNSPSSPPASRGCRVLRHYSQRVSPFGHLRVTACLRLTEAYRSLPRPSSPLYAKSSTVSP